MQQTSLIAYKDIKKTLGKRQQQVLSALAIPRSNAEIARALHLPINSVTPRVLELRNKGLVRKAGTTKISGRLAIVWERTDATPQYDLFGEEVFCG